ncbi:MAG: helix-turn-helix domain-containing protein [Nannocystis sp.]|nr:helix-turn-helix domain-containing protein [Nannocystis sp.]
MRTGRHYRLETQEREQAQAFIQQVFGDLRLDLVDSQFAFEWRVDVLDLGPVMVMPTVVSGGVRLDGTASNTIIGLQSRGQARAGDGRDEIMIARDRVAAVYSAGARAEWESDGDLQSSAVIFQPEFLRRQLELLTGTTVLASPRFSLELPTGDGAGAGIGRICQFLLAEVPRGIEPLDHPVVVASLCDTLARALLVGHAHDFSDLLARAPKQADPKLVRQVEEYVRAHASGPISLGELALLTGTSLQAIEATFKTQRGTTLSAFIRSSRLEHAREALLSDPTLTPTRAVYVAGFLQPERFVAEYFLAFGEHPEETWRRARQGHAYVRSPEVPTVFVICDEPRRCANLHAWLRAAGHGVELFDSARAFVRGDHSMRAGCVVLDLSLADHALVAEQAPRLPRVCLATPDVAIAIAAMKLGAHDVLSCSFESAELLGAVETALGRDAAQRRVAAERAQWSARMASLSPRELEVCERVARGLLNKQVAAELGISEATVKVHRARGMAKLGVGSAVELLHVLRSEPQSPALDVPPRP